MPNIPPDLIRPIAVSLVLVASLFVLRWIVTGLIWRNKDSLSATERKLLALTRNVTVFLSLLGLVFIWAPALSDFALSITAFAVAIVIATKELILCISGAFWRAIAKPFDIGDWVEINHERGEVLELNLLATELAELDGEGGKFTGKTIVIPNSQLLTGTVRNDNLWRRYTHHHFKLVADYGADVMAIDARLSEKVRDRCREFRPVAERYLSSIRRKVGVDLPPAEPRVDVGTSNEGRPTFTVHLFCPVDQCGELQQSLSHDFFTLLIDHGPPVSGPTSHAS